MELLDFRKALTFSRRNRSRSSLAVRVGEWFCINISFSAIACVDRGRGKEMLVVVHYESLPTSSLAPAVAAETSAGKVDEALFDLGLLCLLSSSAEESAILRRLSAGEETEEEVLRLLLAAGAYRSIERCLFLSLWRTGVGLLVRGAGAAGENCSVLL